MNNSRRAMIRKAQKNVQDAYDLIDIACEQEDDALNNMPENLEGTSRYETMADYVDRLENARDILEEAVDAVQEILT